MKSAEQIIEDFCGESAKNIQLTMININSSCNEGRNSESANILKFIDGCFDYHTIVLKNAVDMAKKTKISLKSAVQKINAPIWLSPSSHIHIPHPIEFGWNVETEAAAKAIGAYATHQVFTLFDNTHLVAAGDSKLKYDSRMNRAPEFLLGTEDAPYGKKETDWCENRGLCNHVGLETKDFCRYAVTYPLESGKFGMSLICGDMNFLNGSQDIFKDIRINSDIIASHEKNEKRNGINLPEINITYKDVEEPASVAVDDKNKLKNGKKVVSSNRIISAASVSLARLIGGSIFVHDHLKMLRDIHGVKSIIAFDTSAKSKSVKKESIDNVIDDYARIKMFYAVTKQLNFIK